MSEELEQAKLSLHNARELVDIKNNPIVDSVLLAPIKAIPVIGDFIDSSAQERLNDFQQKKEQELLDVILKDSNIITSGMVNDVEFIVNYNRTLEAVRRLATNDKVKYFGNLIRNGYLSGGHISNTQFEEYLNILNSMSYREIQYLVDYFKFCNGRHLIGIARLNIWYDFVKEYSSRIKVKQGDLYSAFARMTKTGFIQSFYVTSQGAVEESKISEMPAEQDGFLIDKSFSRFYQMVLEMGE